MTRRPPLAERLTGTLPGFGVEAPSPVRVDAGRAGFLASITWERGVDAVIRCALDAGLLVAAWQVGRPVIGRNPDGSLVHGQTGPDFVCVARDGRVVAVEAKSTADARLPRAMVADHQAAALDAVHDAGGVALLAVELRGVGRYLAPWRALRWAGPRGGASIGAAELAGYELLGDGARCLARYLRRGSP